MLHKVHALESSSYPLSLQIWVTSKFNGYMNHLRRTTIRYTVIPAIGFFLKHHHRSSTRDKGQSTNDDYLCALDYNTFNS